MPCCVLGVSFGYASLLLRNTSGNRVQRPLNEATFPLSNYVAAIVLLGSTVRRITLSPLMMRFFDHVFQLLVEPWLCSIRTVHSIDLLLSNGTMLCIIVCLRVPAHRQ